MTPTAIDEGGTEGLSGLNGLSGRGALDGCDALHDAVTCPADGPGQCPCGAGPGIAAPPERPWGVTRRNGARGRRGAAATRGELRDAGMATAEYAIATVAAAGFAGLLLAILRSDEVRGLLLGIVRGALSV
ncbi:MAG TPA: DUF4244 domain-containing protein [Actinotalea sp.]|nr:DUF4244 domain-containing protein [Actinotalea sp.]